MTFIECVVECATTPELVFEWERLTGMKLKCPARCPIEAAIDQASGFHGFNEDSVKAFSQFVFDYIWMPVSGSKYELSKIP